VIDYRHFGSNFTGDGTFDLANRYNRGRTTTHEVGHWLGLRHTWGDDLFDCSIDDFCADTPATRANSSGIGGDCANENNSCEEVVGDLPDMLQNYMTYADDVCMNLFTVCQAERMRTVIASAVRRKSIIENTPEAPLALTAVYRASGNDILLNWAASPSNNVRSYLLERADSLGGTFKQIAVVEGTAFSDNTIASAESEKTYTYRVVAVSTKNFSMPSNQAQVTTVTSLNNFFAENKFEIYPNPAAENIWLSTKNVGVACLSISIYNLSGKLLATTLWENTNEKKEINISRFPKGLYLLNIQSENKSLRKKIVKY